MLGNLALTPALAIAMSRHPTRSTAWRTTSLVAAMSVAPSPG
ncbi:MAG TPA: hypothetical protein VF854_06055 [Azonexus sp.]|jgi:hypothetical protein